MQSPKKQVFTPIKTERASEIIFAQLRDHILNGELAPGDVLPSERKLMEVFQRSRNTIREALRMLENSGLIEISPGKGGAVVCEASLSSIEQPLSNLIHMQRMTADELYELRSLIEIACCGWAAARRTPSDIAALKKVILSAQLSLDHTGHFIDLDQEFHHLLASISKNRLAGIVNEAISTYNYEALQSSILAEPPHEQKENCIRILQGHKKITEAIEARDPIEAERQMELHLVNFQKMINNI